MAIKEEDLKIEIIKIEAFSDGLKQGAILLAKKLLEQIKKDSKKEE